MQAFPFSNLSRADLVVDATYEGGRSGNAGDDPFPQLLGLSNQGGFRYRGSLAALKFVALTSSMNDPDWPDTLDAETGTLTYFGDNKHPGRGLHDTPRYGNEILRNIFESAQAGRKGRLLVPPVFVFANTGTWRDVRFLGLAVPGGTSLTAAESLVAIWRTARGRRFQNYRARFSILNVPVVSRDWIHDIDAGRPHTLNTPSAWTQWVHTGQADVLIAPRSVEFRTRSEQQPTEPEGQDMLTAIHSFFQDRPHDFEYCAGRLVRMLLPDIAWLDLTRPSRDGGRDAVGRLRIGTGPASVLVDFAMEAKCYAPTSPVRVREVSRLISRLRHRQFGIMITTSFVHDQAYREIKEDGHPIIVVSGVDIVKLLRTHGVGTLSALRTWLDEVPEQSREASIPQV